MCREPVFVNTFPFSFSGSSDGAPVVDPNSGALSCFLDLVNDETAGIWFKLIGKGTCITASTAGSDLNTILAVYEGDCDSLLCLTGNSEASPDMSSEVLFFAERDKRYRMLVGGAIFAGRGDFDLVISVRILHVLLGNGQLGSLAYLERLPISSIQEEENGECANHGFYCNYDVDNDFHACLFPQQGSFPFNSTPSFLAAACQNAPFSEPTPENCNCFVGLGEFQSFNFGNVCRICSFLPQTNTSDGEWSITFDCSNILTGPCVGLDANGDCISNGNSTDAPQPTDDYTCNNATVADQLPFFDSGNVQSLQVLGSDFDAFTCPTISSGPVARWYRIAGTSSCIRASTTGSTFDTVLSVYGGECGSVTCLRENDDTEGGGLTSEVEWFGQDGEIYFILLSSFGNVVDSDGYNLSVTVSPLFPPLLL